MLKKIHQMSKGQVRQLEELRKLCKTMDGSTPNLYTHILTQPRVFPASIMYYNEKKQLIAFLGVYFFYDDAVEVSLMVHPAYRRRGIGKQLILNMIPLIKSQNFPKLIFSSPSQRNTSWLTTGGYSYMHSEYYMERDDLNPLLEYQKHNLTYRIATLDDIPLLSDFDEACFSTKPAESLDRFQHLLNSRDYEVYIAYENDIPVGKAHLRWLDNGATLSDIAVMPDKQGKGLGTTLITYCINLALSQGKPHLNLDVETHNERALKLYTRLGFVTQNACDYWAISVNKYLS